MSEEKSDYQIIKERTVAVRETIDREIDYQDPEQLKAKLVDLMAVIGLSAELQAGAGKLIRIRELQEYAGMSQTKMPPPSIVKKVLEGSTAEERALYEYCDRLNAGIVHAIDGIRTLISLYKTELDKSI